MNYKQTSTHIDEGEKPFWISYSDLMTALMVLFLVVMVVSLTSISQQAIRIKEEGLQKLQNPPLPKPDPIVEKIENSEPYKKVVDTAEVERLSEIKTVCDEIGFNAAQKNIGVRVDCNFNKIDFGPAGRFDRGEYKLNPEGEQQLKEIVPIILEAAQSNLGEKWLRRIHIQGFTDTDGSYLYNLNLSLKRSEWVMCKILANTSDNNLQLTPEQRTLVKKLFLAGGVSFNNSRSSKEASRRIELKLEYYNQKNKDENDPDYEKLFANDSVERCQI